MQNRQDFKVVSHGGTSGSLTLIVKRIDTGEKLKTSSLKQQLLEPSNNSEVTDNKKSFGEACTKESITQNWVGKKPNFRQKGRKRRRFFRGGVRKSADNTRPDVRYKDLIEMAFADHSKERQMEGLRCCEISRWIREKFPYFNTLKHLPQCVVQSLLSYKCFKKYRVGTKTVWTCSSPRSTKLEELKLVSPSIERARRKQAGNASNPQIPRPVGLRQKRDLKRPDFFRVDWDKKRKRISELSPTTLELIDNLPAEQRDEILAQPVKKEKESRSPHCSVDSVNGVVALYTPNDITDKTITTISNELAKGANSQRNLFSYLRLLSTNDTAMGTKTSRQRDQVKRKSSIVNRPLNFDDSIAERCSVLSPVNCGPPDLDDIDILDLDPSDVDVTDGQKTGDKTIDPDTKQDVEGNFSSFDKMPLTIKSVRCDQESKLHLGKKLLPVKTEPSDNEAQYKVPKPMSYKDMLRQEPVKLKIFSPRNGYAWKLTMITKKNLTNPELKQSNKILLKPNLNSATPNSHPQEMVSRSPIKSVERTFQKETVSPRLPTIQSVFSINKQMCDQTEERNTCKGKNTNLASVSQSDVPFNPVSYAPFPCGPVSPAQGYSIVHVPALVPMCMLRSPEIMQCQRSLENLEGMRPWDSNPSLFTSFLPSCGCVHPLPVIPVPYSGKGRIFQPDFNGTIQTTSYGRRAAFNCPMPNGQQFQR